MGGDGRVTYRQHRNGAARWQGFIPHQLPPTLLTHISLFLNFPLKRLVGAVKSN